MNLVFYDNEILGLRWPTHAAEMKEISKIYSTFVGKPLEKPLERPEQH
jgi:hypothetical protein